MGLVVRQSGGIQMKTAQMMKIAMMCAVICVLGFVKIDLPFSPVPITGQTLGIMLAGLVLAPVEAAMSVLLFVLLGVLGVPVFSGGTAGLPVLMGPRGGYIVGFVVAAYVIALVKGKDNNLIRHGIASAIGGIIVVYALGVPWLAFVTKMDLSKAIMAGAVPFLIGDVMKVVLATVLGNRINKSLKSMNR